MKVKSKDGFYVTGTVSELMRDQMKEGTLLQCTSYDSGSFEAKVLNVSDYPVDSSNNFIMEEIPIPMYLTIPLMQRSLISRFSLQIRIM